MAPAKAAAARMVIDPDSRQIQGEPLELYRQGLFADVVDEIGIPAGMDGARILAGTWATVAIEGRTLFQIARALNIPLTRVEAACRALNEAGAMEAARGKDGAMYYKLSLAGMRMGQRLSTAWLKISLRTDGRTYAD